MRINKYIAQSGHCSRRQADALIDQGRVTINDVLATHGTQVNDGDIVKVGQKVIGEVKENKVYLAYHKPKGVICTTDRSKKRNLASQIKIPERIFSIGRLDVASTGLLLLTNDGDIVNKVNKAENKLEKEYIVRVNKSISANLLHGLRNGIEIDGKKTLPAKVNKINNFEFSIILVQGWNRQIRKMCEAFDYEVTALTRIRVGEIILDNLASGEWRYIKKEDIGFQ